MNFEEWYSVLTNNDGYDDFWTKSGLEKSWNAAIDEAVRVASRGENLDRDQTRTVKAIKRIRSK